MIDATSLKKHHVVLEDYDFRRDLHNRLLLAQLTAIDRSVLEEIIYSSLTIPVRKLAKTLDLSEHQLIESLKKLAPSGLFTWTEDTIAVDKESRKYFEVQILRFDPQFKPSLEFLQGLLKQVPIHVLPNWYAISRMSDNIFESIMEKHLLTPSSFHRYLMEGVWPDPLLIPLFQAVCQAPNQTIPSQELMDRYSLSLERFEKLMLYLEFSFLCCQSYREEVAIVTPFYEWHEYLRFLKATESSPIDSPSSIARLRPDDFSFVNDLALLLELAQKQPISLPLEGFSVEYGERLVSKLKQIKLGNIVNQRLYALESAHDYLQMKEDERSLFLYRHPLNRVQSSLFSDRQVKEAEKSLERVLYQGWVYLEEFLKGITVPLSDNSLISLRKQGRSWKYSLPVYSDEERQLIRELVINHLFELGVTSVGLHNDRACFAVTRFGQTLFGK